jgi:DNA (cytosine-5)-methyltransferase 1
MGVDSGQAARAGLVVAPANSPEVFHWTGKRLLRRVTDRVGREFESPMPVSGSKPPRARGEVARATAEKWLLRSVTPPAPESVRGSVSVVDLFAGCGGLSLGLQEACRALGLGFIPALAVDTDDTALSVYADNFLGANCTRRDVAELFDGEVGRRLTSSERQVKKMVGSVDILAGGPPCQGHSDLNNRTRNNDLKNRLYMRMVRAAEVLDPEHLLIENVPGALRDRGRVVQHSIKQLTKLGYDVQVQVVDLKSIGVPQARRRLVVVASKDHALDLKAMIDCHQTTATNVRWAIGDLVRTRAGSLLDTPAVSAPQTRDRIRYLFERDLYELPNDQRPKCHANGHSYVSIYGRLRWENASQTITTGFYSMCMGRYVHPALPRTLTAHEAARLQFFPDYFRFSRVAKRGELARLIGNAVPMKLGYVIGLELLR